MFDDSTATAEPSKIYVIIGADVDHTTSGTLEAIKEAAITLNAATGMGTDEIEIVITQLCELGIDPFLVENISFPEPIIRAAPARFTDWDTEGIHHAKSKHDRQILFNQWSTPAVMHRRMEKRPYSGQCNLRF